MKNKLGLVGENGQPLNVEKPLLDAQGNEVVKEEQATTADVGAERARVMIELATKHAPNNETLNIHLDVLHHMALNILSHRIVNLALGMNIENNITEWDASRAFAAEKEVQESLSLTVNNWKTSFFNGELIYTPDKPN